MANIPISLGHPRKPSGSVNIIQNGTHDVTQYASAVVNVPTGGASNIVTGTFTGTTTNEALEITLNYSGNGYPVAVVIYPTEGPYNSSTGTFYNLVQRYATQTLLFVKDKMTAPSYTNSGVDDNATVINRYKNSASSATNYTASGSNGNGAYQQGLANGGASTGIVRFSSKTKMSVFIAGTSYGFAANIEYTYHVIYSS